MVILENLRDPMKFWKICVEMMNMSWKFPRKSENPLIFFEGHVKVTRNYMRKQLDERSAAVKSVLLSVMFSNTLS